MEEEVKGQEIRLDIYKHDLTFLESMIDFKNVYFINDLEIEPFEKFSLGFSAEYWFLQYNLLKENKYLVDDNFEYFFSESQLNIIFLNISDLNNFILKCNDGIWYLKILKNNAFTKKLITIFQSLDKA